MNFSFISPTPGMSPGWQVKNGTMEGLNLPKKAETQIASQAGMRLPFSHQKQHTSSSGGVVAKGFFNHHEQQRFEPLVIQNPTYPG